MNHEPDWNETIKQWHGTMQGYWIGLGASLILTIGAFLLVISQIDFPKIAIVLTLVTLALMQAAAQLLFFLHVGQEPKPRWETVVFSFMGLVLFIIVTGTLWIMFDLNNRVMNM